MKKNSLLLILPTRSRPASLLPFFEAFEKHSHQADLLVALDEDDPSDYPRLPGVKYEVNPRFRLCEKLNLVARRNCHDYQFLAFMGDDNRIRTANWDQIMCERIQEKPGICYGNDLYQGPTLPTSVLLSSSIVRTLGYMAPPAMVHLYIDNFWRTLGEKLGILHYFPDVIIEHLHYTNKKAEFDPLYAESNSPERYARDRAAFTEYCNSQLEIDVEKVRKIL